MRSAERKKPTRTLSERQKRLAELVAEGKYCMIEAMEKAGYKHSTACAQARRTRSNPLVRKAIVKARLKRGLYCSAEELELIGAI